MTRMDWAIVGAYLLVSLAMGIFLSRRAGRSLGEYFLSGRSLPWWIAGTSMVATSFSADTPLVVTGWVRGGGISQNWVWWAFAIGGMFSVFLLSRLWRRAKVLTDVEMTELRFSGRSAAALRGVRAAYFALPINCITLAWVMVAMLKLLKEIFGVEPLVATALCVFIATGYSVLSGFWGVVVTDLLQFVVAMVGSVVLCWYAVAHLGGLGALAEHAAQASPLGERVLHFFPTVSLSAQGGSFWSGPFFAFCVFVSVLWWANRNADGGGVVVQRMAAAKDESQALRATLWFNVANYALRPWPWILVALASIWLFPDLADHEAAYPRMIRALVPPGLLGLMVASLVAAFMSTIDTHLNLSASYVVNDFYKRFIRKDASERHYVLVSRLASAGFVVISAVIALVYDTIAGLFTFLLAFSSGVGLVYLARWFWWRVNAWSEISAMVASSVIAGAIYVWPALFGNPPYAVRLLITVAGSTAVWLVVTFATAPVEKKRLVAFYRRVRPYGLWGQIAKESGVAPPRGLGFLLGAWLTGAAMVLGATFALGKLLLVQFAAAVVWASASGISAGLCAWCARKARIMERTSHPAHPVGDVSDKAAHVQQELPIREPSVDTAAI